MPPISVLIKPASGLCNMQCAYCFYHDEQQKREQVSYGFMTEQTLRNVIRKTILKAEGSVSYAYQGGEPTLRGIDFFEKAVLYQRQYNKHGVRVMNALQTNGLLLDEKWCKFLKENHFLVGVSVDGTKETHDRYRHSAGGGTYDRVKRATELLEQYGVDYNILTVVSNQVAEHISEIYKEYKRIGWNYQQYIACLDPLDEPHGKSEYALKPEQYGRFLSGLFKLWYQDWKNTGKIPYIRQFENYIGILMGYRPEACDQRGVCGVQYVVEADGGVYPCDFYMTDAYRIGNFNENQLNQIDEKRKEIGFLERSVQISEKCKECLHYALCRGGCQRNRDYDETTGRYGNYFCEGYRIFFTECREMLEEIAAETVGKKGW